MSYVTECCNIYVKAMQIDKTGLWAVCSHCNKWSALIYENTLEKYQPCESIMDLI